MPSHHETFNISTSSRDTITESGEVGTFKMSVKIKLQSSHKNNCHYTSSPSLPSAKFSLHITMLAEKPIENSQTTDYFIYSAQWIYLSWGLSTYENIFLHFLFSFAFFPSGVYNLLLNTISPRCVLAYERHRSAGSSRNPESGGWKQVKHKVEDVVITLNWQQNIFIFAGSFFFFLLQRRTSVKKFGAKNNKFIDIHVRLMICRKECIRRIYARWGRKVLTRRRITRGERRRHAIQKGWELSIGY